MTSDNKMVDNSAWTILFPSDLLSLSLFLSSASKKFPQLITSFISVLSR